MLEKILRLFITGGVFLLPLIPLVVSSSMFFPYITGKAFMFRIITELIIAAWLGLLFVNNSYRPKNSLVAIAFVVFTLVVGFADVFGVNTLRSFWSNYERMEGFITILHLVGLFLVAGAVMRKEKTWTLFWNVSVAISVILCFKSFLAVNDGVVRSGLTLGNPTYLAVYLLFHIFVTLWLAYKHRFERMKVVVYLSVLALQIPALYFTGTRGTLLGLLAGCFIAALGVLMFGSEHPIVRRLSAGGLVVLVLGVGGFFAFRDAPLVQNSAVLSRFANISLQDATTESRITLWSKIALPAFQERPLLGWGQDNFIIVFGKYYDPVMYKQEPWFDRAHNVFVDWLIAAGILGLLAYLFLFGAGVRLLWRIRMSIPEKSILTGLFAGYAIHNFFVFDNLVSYVYFALVLAWIHSMHVHKDKVDVRTLDTQDRDVPQTQLLVAGIGIIAISIVWVLNVRGIVEAQTLLTAIRAERAEQNYAKAHAAYQEKFSGSWLGLYEAREQFAQMTARLSVAAPDDSGVVLLQRQAEEQLLNAIAEDPQNTRHRSFLGLVYRQAGEYDKAIEAFRQALAFNGMRQIFLYDLAEAYEAGGFIDEAVETYAHAFRVEETNAKALGLYVSALSRAGREEDAEALQEQYAFENPSGVAQGYLEGGFFQQAAEAYEDIITSGDATAETYATLGFIYLKLKQPDEAVRILKQLQLLFPDAYGDEVQRTIQAIQSGGELTSP